MSKLQRLWFGGSAAEKHHEFFGKILFMGGVKPRADDYWENEQYVIELQKPITVLITAGLDGPDAAQITFYKQCTADLDQLFQKCWPIFEPDFQMWTKKKFSGKWQDDFELISLEIPLNGDADNPWSVCYFVEATNHYFSACFENNIAAYNLLDG